jgi:hypothetical protein
MKRLGTTVSMNVSDNVTGLMDAIPILRLVGISYLTSRFKCSNSNQQFKEHCLEIKVK